MQNFKWIGSSLYYSREFLKCVALPFQVAGWIADKIVSLTFVGFLVLIWAWYTHQIPEKTIDNIMNEVGSRIISHVGALSHHDPSQP